MRRSLTLVLALFGTLVLFLVPRASAAGGVGATFAKTSDWGSAYQAQYTITNNSGSTLSSWKVEFDLPSGTGISSSWDADLAQSGTHFTFTNKDYNGSLAPGASTVFGWVSTGAGTPVDCLLNGGSCDAGAPGGSGGTTGGGTPPPPPDTPVHVAPYVDMGAWPTPSLTTMATSGGLKDFTLAFVTSTGCKASWFNAYDPRQAWARDQVDAIRSAGGDVKISFGGASGVELAQDCTSVDALTAEYAAVVDAYDLRYVDFDIEGAAVAQPASIALRSQALAELQRTHPGLRVSLTLPVLPTGLTQDGLNVVASAIDAGVSLDLVNVMAMDYYQSGTDYGDAAVQAATSVEGQLKTLYPNRTDAQLWAMVGVTPMLGQNDDGHLFDQADARQLVAFAQSKHLGMLAYWEEGRDANACTGAVFQCTNVPQTPYEFSKIFAGYTG